jgi:hypothetical protein
VISVHSDIKKYNAALLPADGAICQLLAKEIDRSLPEAEGTCARLR